MASKTLTFGQSGSRPYGVLTVSETSTSTQNNTSTVSITLTLKRPYAISSSQTKTAKVVVNGTAHTWSGSIGGSGDKVLISKTQTITHNADGKKTISLSASITLDITWDGSAIGTITGTGSLALTNIPRYATISQTLASKTETTATIKWSSDAVIDYIWYSTNNGNNWTGVNVSDGKTGSYNISNLSSGTSYNVKTRVRRKDSQLTTDSSTLTIKTFDWPNANSMPNFTIGNSVTIGITNPLGRSCTVEMLAADGAVVGSATTSGTSVAGWKSASHVSALYASIPNAKSANYRVRVTYFGHVSTKTGGSYQVNEQVCAPVIGATQYQDQNATTVGVTEDASLCVQRLSQLRVAATRLEAKNGATLASCTFTVLGTTYAMAFSSDYAYKTGITIDSGQNVTGIITLTDSRGVKTTAEVEIAILELQMPSAVISASRQSGYYSETVIKCDGQVSPVNGGNTMAISYSASSPGSGLPSVSGIVQNGEPKTVILDNNYAWTITITITDVFGQSTTYNAFVSRGLPLIYFDRLKNSVGINCIPNLDNELEIDNIPISRNSCTIFMNQTLSGLQAATSTVLSLVEGVKVGNKLSVSNGGILIGAGVSVVKVSGFSQIDAKSSTGIRALRIVKNQLTNDANTIALNILTMAANDRAVLEFSPLLYRVVQGDLISLAVYAGNTADQILGSSIGMYRTALTVEAVA